MKSRGSGDIVLPHIHRLNGIICPEQILCDPTSVAGRAPPTGRIVDLHGSRWSERRVSCADESISNLPSRRSGGLQPNIAHCEHRYGSYKADKADDEESGDVGSPRGARHASGEGGDGATQLMAGEDPTDDDRRLRGSEMLRRKLHCRRHGGDEVQSEEDRPDRQCIDIEAAEWQPDQRQAAQAVVPGQQNAIIETVG